ncbi:MAG: hypothetical protein MMC23_005833 [Stictis urceolatum]|nr:hypothetical protein [Stictis urceolata]
MGAYSDDRNERIPTYEESVGQDIDQHPPSHSSSKQSIAVSPRQGLPSLLADTRSDRINAIITTYINPLLETQAIAGLYKTTIVLVPSNSNSLQTATNSQDIIEGSGDSIAQKDVEAVVGFPDEDYVKLVRLHGQEYATEFWRQPAVIQELESNLKARLAAGGHKIEEPPKQQETPQAPAAAPGSRSMPPKAKMGLFRRKMKETTASEPAVASPSGAQTAARSKLSPGAVRLKIALEDISMRAVTEMGLYETKSGKALIVNMEIGA